MRDRGCALERVSVVIPTRNEAHQVGAVLEALPAEVELVVVDASDDGTDRLIEAMRPRRTRVVRSRAGIAAARQIGAQAAGGEWLLFSDADVRFEPAFFERLPRRLEGDAFYGLKRATERYPRYGAAFGAAQRLLHALRIPAASGSNMAVRRSVFEAVGGFRQELPVNEDTELMMRIAHRGYRVECCPDLVVRSLDDRRLDRGLALKSVHSLSRGLLLWVDLRWPLPGRWLRHDWGYWQPAAPPPVARPRA
jgi:glycosyltransferase involved in cell wall biosynthesis